MKTYLVGGAVRDKLLGLPVYERDWVVVGSTEQEMLRKGFRSVGSNFPVFLHPQSNEEYALARTERKTGPGHKSFHCRCDPQVTLEEDLGRRDLTINAIAETETGVLIDPHAGRYDLKRGFLRHISSAFEEDPLRILRVARFNAKFHHRDFSVAPETTQLIKKMVKNREHTELSAERVLMELDKALITKNPAEFFRFLAQVGADAALWPEINYSAYDRLSTTSSVNPETRFAVLFLDLAPDNIRTLCGRLKTSNSRLELTILIANLINIWSSLGKLTPETKVEFVTKADGIRKAKRFNSFNLACEEITGLPMSNDWQNIRDIMSSVKAQDLEVTAKGRQLGELIRQAQIRKIGELH